MKFSIKTILGALFLVGILASCSDQSCDDLICPNGFVQSYNSTTEICDCVEEEKDSPCDGFTCPAGYSIKITGDNCECEQDQTGNANIVSKAGFISENETWEAENIYFITGKVVVSQGITLTIEPGTVIKAAQGTGSLASALIIARGGKLEACGSAEAPIIFTSELDNIEPGQKMGTNLDINQKALWGGLIVLGYAPSSFEGDVSQFQIEGIPADDTFGLYGGSDPNDNSGNLCYISIRHGGASIGENNEINGLTLGGVGAGTRVDNIEVVANLDDGIEFFGGTVNVTNAIVWAQGDDAYDVDQAYSGTLDNFVSIAGEDSDHSLEIDGPEGSATGRFTFTNGTLKGLHNEMADFRKGAMGTLNNITFFNFDNNGDLEIDDNESSANYFSGLLELKNNYFVDTRSVSEICNDKAVNGDDEAFDIQMEMDNYNVNPKNQGADISRFNWSYTANNNMLDF